MTYGESRRYYDNNGQLYQAIDTPADGSERTNSTSYKISTLQGIRARSDRSGQTNYLTVAGKTIGDLQLAADGSQHLNVYGGFTPVGSQQASKPFLSSTNFFDSDKQAWSAVAEAAGILANRSLA